LPNNSVHSSDFLEQEDIQWDVEALGGLAASHKLGGSAQLVDLFSDLFKVVNRGHLGKEIVDGIFDDLIRRFTITTATFFGSNFKKHIEHLAGLLQLEGQIGILIETEALWVILIRK
jgi:hypothetical protein